RQPEVAEMPGERAQTAGLEQADGPCITRGAPGGKVEVRAMAFEILARDTNGAAMLGECVVPDGHTGPGPLTRAKRTHRDVLVVPQPLHRLGMMPRHEGSSRVDSPLIPAGAFRGQGAPARRRNTYAFT